MDFVAVVLFLVMYYLRPQEWPYGLHNLRPVQLTMMLALVSLMLRDQKLKGHGFFKTPHDWMMAAFFAWMVFTAPSPWDTFKEVSNLMLFYVAIVQVLTTQKRIRHFLMWWAVMIVAVASLAVASEFGFDPLGSYDKTHGIMKGRLVLNLWIFNNPNALGHSILPVIPMIFFLWYWKRLVFMKELARLLLVIPGYCIYLTVSKGAFLAGALTILATLTFGRPKVVQALILMMAILFGSAAVHRLPRMEELKKSRTDEAIMGRIAAYEFGLHCMETLPTGIGKGAWMGRFYREYGYWKAPHSSYNNIGGEMGYTGLFLYLGNLYCALRTVVTVRTRDVEDERIRRTLFVLIFSFMVSGWMVDFAYRPVYFMFIAATAAFHRLLIAQGREQEPVTEKAAPVLPWMKPAASASEPEQLAPAPMPGLVVSAHGLSPALAGGPPAGRFSGPRLAREEPVEEEKVPRPIRWNRIGWIDLVIVYLMLKGAQKMWYYILTTM